MQTDYNLYKMFFDFYYKRQSIQWECYLDTSPIFMVMIHKIRNDIREMYVSSKLEISF